jgi:UDP-N-acetylmuramoylalanine--D-glutamate ligase
MPCGPAYLDRLDRFDVIIKSPGVPPESRIKNYESRITSATQLFLNAIAETGALVIGVTGSKGKSTTSSLIYEILKAAGNDAYLIGNIGIPALDFLERTKSNTIFVQEMSSYQLMDLTVSPHIAVITAFFPEHLDYHGSLGAYLEAKKHITRFQHERDSVIFSADSEGAREIAGESRGKRIPYSASDSPVRIEETQLLGKHNLSNIAAAWKVVQELGVPREIASRAIKNFHGLPHRLQSLGAHDGIEWIDDSISTTPESAIAALNALGEHVNTIILGGQDRGNDFTELGKRIAASQIENIILFPVSGPRIRTAIEKAWAGTALHFFEIGGMEEAITISRQYTKRSHEPTIPRPIVLLSPASPSYGLFRNFEERGEAFRRAIMKTAPLSVV